MHPPLRWQHFSGAKGDISGQKAGEQAMAVVQFQGKTVEVSEEDTLLSAFERAKVALPNACGTGLCQLCLMVARRGKIPAEAQIGLDNRQLKANMFLACCCKPAGDLVVSLPDDDFFNQGELIDAVPLNNEVLRVRIKSKMKWEAGQYTTVWRTKSVGRPFSIASLPGCGYIELHMRRRHDGVVSRWLEEKLKPGDIIRLSEAKGYCYYSVPDDSKPMVLAGTGTGLAPLYGILQEALANGHRGKITLYAAVGRPSQLYLVKELTRLATRHSNFYYVPVVRRKAKALEGTLEGDLIKIVTERHAEPAGHYIYLCGAPDLVSTLKRKLFRQGASANHIFADAFEISYRGSITSL